MLVKDGKKVLQIYITDKLENEFTNAVPERKKSDIIRGMMMMYLQNGTFKRQVDSFIAVTKTI